ncbi:YraN family protein [Gammaproteobacteria bacterium 45_16_T64]|nr:YraN family protein [Gammaproteobacteria bacterium 45_16_T64]
MTNSSPKTQIGNQAESEARTYLEQRGLTFKESNFGAKTGEIDLIMIESSTLVFIEVRFRRKLGFGSAAETVTYHKQRKLRKTAQLYMLKRFKTVEIDCRFDVVGIDYCPKTRTRETTWIKSAF